jgi:hypothetical protein
MLEIAHSPRDLDLAADPASPEWADAASVTASRDYFGQSIPGGRLRSARAGRR